MWRGGRLKRSAAALGWLLASMLLVGDARPAVAVDVLSRLSSQPAGGDRLARRMDLDDARPTITPARRFAVVEWQLGDEESEPLPLHDIGVLLWVPGTYLADEYDEADKAEPTPHTPQVEGLCNLRPSVADPLAALCEPSAYGRLRVGHLEHGATVETALDYLRDRIEARGYPKFLVVPLDRGFIAILPAERFRTIDLLGGGRFELGCGWADLRVRVLVFVLSDQEVSYRHGVPELPEAGGPPRAPMALGVGRPQLPREVGEIALNARHRLHGFVHEFVRDTCGEPWRFVPTSEWAFKDHWHD